MKKNLLRIIGVIIFAILVFGGFWLWKNFRGAQPAFRKPSQDITQQIPASNSLNLPEAVNNTDFPLKLSEGFVISILAKNLPGARVVAISSDEKDLWVSQTKEGKISHIALENGKLDFQVETFKNLKNPHGLVFDPNEPSVLYVAEEHQITKNDTYAERGFEKIIDLPKGGRHTTRSLHFGNDGRLYVSIGSTCDVCHEKDERVATIYSMNKDGSDFKKIASGLRNSVFMATNPADGKIWATEMGRDNLGDELPPDEVNIIETGPSLRSGQSQAPTVTDFGWPYCYGKNIQDFSFVEKAMDCSIRSKESFIDLPAHSAPLGLAFVPSTSNWPKEYHNNLIVAFHGSWNRSEPTGYKLTRIKLNQKGDYKQVEDFISGWLSLDGKTSLGRPVDVKILSSGIMYVSDDKAGVIYKVEYFSNN